MNPFPSILPLIVGASSQSFDICPLPSHPGWGWGASAIDLFDARHCLAEPLFL